MVERRMTNDEQARALGAWVRDRAHRADLGDATHAWLATSPGADDRPPADVLADLLIALAAPGVRRTIVSGELDALADGVDEARLTALRRIAEHYDAEDDQGRMS
ncbi:MAG: hypothetical protein Tsb0013_20430 [Phycisphaerales bacterium]